MPSNAERPQRLGARVFHWIQSGSSDGGGPIEWSKFTTVPPPRNVIEHTQPAAGQLWELCQFGETLAAILLYRLHGLGIHDSNAILTCIFLFDYIVVKVCSQRYALGVTML